MMSTARFISRIAMFSALCYVLAWLCFYLPNFNLIFFVVFTAGFLWGPSAGVTVGMIGMGMWTMFNPFGPADPAIMLAQVFGMSISGVVGALFRAYGRWEKAGWQRITKLVLASLICTVMFFLPVSIADAWVYQPFWPRLISGIIWSLWSVLSNAIVFPLLFSVTLRLYSRERSGIK